MSMFFGGCPLCWDKDCNCDPKDVDAYIEKSKNEIVERKASTTTVDNARKQLGSNPFPGNIRVVGPGEVEPDVIILAGTDGNDYDVLDKVDPRVKLIATSGNPPTEEDLKLIKDLSFGISIVDHRHTDYIKDATEETLTAAEGKSESFLTPENKHWILREMGFKGLGGGKWKHILFDETIEFNLDGSTLIQLAFAIHKTGYKNAQTEFDQTGTL